MFLPGATNQISENLIPKDGTAKIIHPFINEDNSYKFFEKLKSTINWKQDDIKMFGKTHPTPRLQAWYGDNDTEYSYSGIKLTPSPWNELLLELKTLVEKECQCHFNSVLLNYYRDNNDHVSWHADDEPELGKNPLIASLSFGATRVFQLQHKLDKKLKVSMSLDNGSLLIMKDELQHNWIHRLAKSSKFIDPRINLTFRTIKK